MDISVYEWIKRKAQLLFIVARQIGEPLRIRARALLTFVCIKSIIR